MSQQCCNAVLRKKRRCESSRVTSSYTGFDPISYKTKLLSIVHGKTNYNNWCGYLK